MRGNSQKEEQTNMILRKTRGAYNSLEKDKQIKTFLETETKTKKFVADKQKWQQSKEIYKKLAKINKVKQTIYDLKRKQLFQNATLLQTQELLNTEENEEIEQLYDEIFGSMDETVKTQLKNYLGLETMQQMKKHVLEHGRYQEYKGPNVKAGVFAQTYYDHLVKGKQDQKQIIESSLKLAENWEKYRYYRQQDKEYTNAQAISSAFSFQLEKLKTKKEQIKPEEKPVIEALEQAYQEVMNECQKHSLKYCLDFSLLRLF